MVILTCLPLLGAQIGKIGGTLNLLKEKAKAGREATEGRQQHTACVRTPRSRRGILCEGPWPQTKQRFLWQLSPILTLFCTFQDLQRWLFKTNAPEKLTRPLEEPREGRGLAQLLRPRKLLDSLTDVLESKDSPMDLKEPIALKFLPSTLLEELHIVKIGQKLEKHQFFHLLMDVSWLTFFFWPCEEAS